MSRRQRQTRLLRLSPVLVAALVTAACGSDTSSEAPTESATESTVGPAAATDSDVDTASAEPTEPAPGSTVEQRDPPDPVTTTAPPQRSADEEPSSQADPDVDCRRISEFDDADSDRWVVVNDGVMGGRSAGTVEFDRSTMRFTGTVVTAGGGFTSVRRALGDELTDTTRVVLRFRPDGRTYGLTFESDAQVGRRSVSYGAVIPVDEAADPDGFQTVSVAYDDLQPSVFGVPVDAPPFDADEGTEIGIIISDGVDGDFALDIDWIDACP